MTDALYEVVVSFFMLGLCCSPYVLTLSLFLSVLWERGSECVSSGGGGEDALLSAIGERGQRLLRG